MKVLECDHSNESCWTVVSCETVCYAVYGFSLEKLLLIKLESLDSVEIVVLCGLFSSSSFRAVSN